MAKKSKQDIMMMYLAACVLFALAALTFFFKHYVVKQNLTGGELNSLTGFKIAFGDDGEVLKYGLIFILLLGAAAVSLVGMLMKIKGNLLFLIAGLAGALAIVLYIIYFFDGKNYGNISAFGGLVEGAKTIWFWLGFIFSILGTAASLLPVVNAKR